MKALARRGFLRTIAAIPVAAAQAKVALAESMSLSGIKVVGSSIGSDDPPPSVGPIPSSGGHDMRLDDQQTSWLMRIPAARAQVRSQLYESHRVVSHIDHDLASKRSFSLAAKVTFQRQRNVEYSLDAMADGYSWQRTQTMMAKLFSALNPLSILTK